MSKTCGDCTKFLRLARASESPTDTARKCEHSEQLVVVNSDGSNCDAYVYKRFTMEPPTAVHEAGTEGPRWPDDRHLVDTAMRYLEREPSDRCADIEDEAEVILQNYFNGKPLREGLE